MQECWGERTFEKSGEFHKESETDGIGHNKCIFCMV